MSEDVKLPYVPALPITNAITQLERMYRGAISCATPMSRAPSVMLWGPPGVGKSQGIRQLGDALSASTGKRAVITDVRLLLFASILILTYGFAEWPDEGMAHGIPVLWLINNEKVDPSWGRVARMKV